jgi:site-specific recombinase XerD
MAAAVRVQRVDQPSGERTWTVLGADYRPIGPVEAFLEYLRVTGKSPNTVRAYARGLELFWRFLDEVGVSWDAVGPGEVSAFVGWLRTGLPAGVVALREQPGRLSEATLSLRLQAVLSFYRFQHFNGVEAASRLYEHTSRPGGGYRPFLLHARRGGGQRPVVRVVQRRREAPPILAPAQIALIKDACACWDDERREWVGSLRDRLLWALLEETGMRVGEALGLQHRDWHTGRGDTPLVEVVPREHPHGVRVKGGAYRRLYVSDELDRLYGEHLWRLVEAGADLAVEDFDEAYVFVNLTREPRFAPMRPSTVDWLVRRLRRQLVGQVPAAWSAHWLRHSHATALLLAGVPLHVVSRRLGHADVQTTQNLYAWVTEDAELRALADWQSITERWRGEGVAR